MNPKEALEILNRGYVWQTEHRREVWEAEKVVEQLVDRATPKKQIDCSSFGVEHDRCPICDTCVSFIDDNPGADVIHNYRHNFCPNCGQAIERTTNDRT